MVDNFIPTVTVLMSVYNGEEHLEKAVDSILEQSYTDFEFVIIDDGSADNSPKILRRYAEADQRVRLISQKNTGLTVALRRGVDAARGRYVARMDADDYSHPTRLAKQVELLEQDGKLVAVTCDVEHFTDDGTIVDVARIRQDPRLLPLLLCFTNRIGGHGQMMYRRDAYHAAGGYDPDFNNAEDYEFWTRLIDEGGFGVVKETLYGYRTGNDSVSSLNADRQSQLATQVTRRQFEKIAGTPLSADMSFALRLFWWNQPADRTSLKNSLRVSRAMDYVTAQFLRAHPHLRSAEYDVRRMVSAKYYWRIRHIPAAAWPHKIVSFANACFWGIKALLARLRYAA